MDHQLTGNKTEYTGARLIRIALWLIVLVTVGMLCWQHRYTIIGWGSADENFYKAQTERLDTNSWYGEWAAGNPVGFTIPVWLLARVGLSYLSAGRILSLLSLLAVTYIIYRYCRYRLRFPSYFPQLISVTFFVIYTCNRYSAMNYSDLFYTLLLTWIQLELISRLYEEDFRMKTYLLLGMAFGMTIIIRPLIPIMGPALCGGFLVYQLARYGFQKRSIALSAIFGIGMAGGVLLVQVPSLAEYGTLKLEYKDPNRKGRAPIKSTWTQRNTLSLYLLWKGEKLTSGNHVTWRESDAYLAEHGPKSMPSTPVERFFWNPGFVLIHMAKGVFLELPKFLLRFTGFLWLLPALLLLPVYSRSTRAWGWFLLAFAVINTLLYSFLGLIFVEGRHYYLLMFILVLGGFMVIARAKPVMRHRLALATVLLLFTVLTLGYRFEWNAWQAHLEAERIEAERAKAAKSQNTAPAQPAPQELSDDYE